MPDSVIHGVLPNTIDVHYLIDSIVFVSILDSWILCIIHMNLGVIGDTVLLLGGDVMSMGKAPSGYSCHVILLFYIVAGVPLCDIIHRCVFAEEFIHHFFVIEQESGLLNTRNTLGSGQVVNPLLVLLISFGNFLGTDITGNLTVVSIIFYCTVIGIFRYLDRFFFFLISYFLVVLNSSFNICNG